ncbi:MAG: alkaline phosphatase [Desulfobacterales bacterium S5133MH4]|nr:MAG: alkaline phosphatase [Desulfobacterales bacterium S5133MH4]
MRYLKYVLVASILLVSSNVFGEPPELGKRLSLWPTSPPIELTFLGRYETGIFDESAAEIVAHDPGTQRLFVVNGDANALDVLSMSDLENPSKLFDILLAPYGDSPTSVAVDNGVVAVAVENGQDPGKVLFLDVNGTFLNSVTVGALPDMVIFTPDGTKVLVANEGEPNDAYTVDPEGSVSIIDISGGMDSATVTTAGFSAFNARAEALKAAGVRIFGPGATVAQDLEPEYIAVSRDSKKAWVSLQENNAVAVLNIPARRITHVLPLGFKDQGLPGNGLDASNKDDAINISTYANIFGMYQPDAIAAFEAFGKQYLITANEGDARDYDGFSEEKRVKKLALDPEAFPNAGDLQQDEVLGRLKVTNTLGDTDEDGDFDELYAYGARSFSIFRHTPSGLEPVYDSGDQFEQITAAVLPEDFNSNNDEKGSFDSRSDDKGPEPEGVTTGVIKGHTFAFIGLERIGGVMVYDMTTPAAPKFVQYINSRDFSGDPASGTAGDLGPEGLIFIPETESPSGKPLLVVAYEVSGSTSIYEINADDLLPSGDLDGDGDVDRDDISIIRVHRGQPASVCPECDIDSDGVITVRDARKLVKMCTRPRCRCD